MTDLELLLRERQRRAAESDLGEQVRAVLSKEYVFTRKRTHAVKLHDMTTVCAEKVGLPPLNRNLLRTTRAIALELGARVVNSRNRKICNGVHRADMTDDEARVYTKYLRRS